MDVVDTVLNIAACISTIDASASSSSEISIDASIIISSISTPVSATSTASTTSGTSVIFHSPGPRFAILEVSDRGRSDLRDSPSSTC